MVSLRARYLSTDEIDQIVTPLLTEAFRAYGYSDKSINEDETFDGNPIIRVKAHVAQPVPVEDLVQTLSRIHESLRAEHDERFVFLSAPGPSTPSPAGDEDEEAL